MTIKPHILFAFLFTFLVEMKPACSENAPQEATVIKYYQTQMRYAFGQQVLELALSKLNHPYSLERYSKKTINEGRGEMLLIKGRIDVQWLATSEYREQKLTPIKIPIYRGLLGLRLLLINKEKKHRFESIKTLQQFQQFKGGHGQHWADLSVYQANDLPVHTNTNYESLFLQLEDNRFDYFHRGVNEIWKESERYKETLEVEDHLMLYYPHPVYFFVNKENIKLANDIEKGLKIALNDGTYKALFFKSQGQAVKRSTLYKRKLIRLNNPILPKNSPPIDTHWWLPTTLN